MSPDGLSAGPGVLASDPLNRRIPDGWGGNGVPPRAEPGEGRIARSGGPGPTEPSGIADSDDRAGGGGWQQPSETQQSVPSLSRDERVAVALREWQRSLADLGGRNSLLWYRDLTSGTLDLSIAHPGGVSMLMAGRATKLSDLVREPSAFAEARRRAHAIHAKTHELRHEHGLDTGYMAIGMATWSLPGHSVGPRPQAPVLLRSCSLRPTGASAKDYDLDLGSGVELNPVLLQYLTHEMGLAVDGPALASLAHAARLFDPVPVFRELTRICAGLPGFRVADRKVVSTFPYAKLAAVMDLATLGGSLAGHDVIAALAGDPLARAAVRSAGEPGAADTAAGTGGAASSDGVPTAVESDGVASAAWSDGVPEPAGRPDLVVLDADDDQRRVLADVLGGRHVVVHSPPGTGATQTIANLVASLAAVGRRVLFVAAKRTAIDDVLQRLDGVGLADLVLDVHEGRDEAPRQVWEVLNSIDAGTSLPRDPGPLSDSAQALLRRLEAHCDGIHRRRAPWQVSVFEAQQTLAELAGRSDPPGSRARLQPAVLASVSRSDLDTLAEQLADLVRAGAWEVGLDPAGDDPWFGGQIVSDAEVSRAEQITAGLAGGELAQTRVRLDGSLAEAGLPAAHTARDWERAVELFTQVRATLQEFSPTVLSDPLDRLIAATGGPAARQAYRDRTGTPLRWWTRWSLRRQAKALVRPEVRVPELHAALLRAQQQREAWQDLAGPGTVPRLPGDLEATGSLWHELAEQLSWLSERLAGSSAGSELLDHPLDEVQSRLMALAARPDRLRVLPDVVPRRAALAAAGLDPLVQELAERGTPASAMAAELSFVWWASVLDAIADADPAYGSHNGTELRSVVAEFGRLEEAERRAAAERVRAVVRETMRRTAAAYTSQLALIRAAAAGRGSAQLRDLLPAARDVLLAARPCWTMSPLVVASQVPPGVWFDVVVVDEASRIPTAHMVSALARGKEAVVFGDQHLLGPAPFFAAAVDEQLTPASDDLVSTRDQQSVLHAATEAFPERKLRWHYRSRDERLVTFVNERVYAGELVTFPAPAGHPPVRVVTVDPDPDPGADPDRANPAPDRAYSVPDSAADLAGDIASGAGSHSGRPGVDAVQASTAVGGAAGARGGVATRTSERQWNAAGVTPTDSQPEVGRVVRLAIDHAVRRPGVSLGVVTVGVRQAWQIQEAMRAALDTYPDPAVLAFFDPHRPEPFLVESLERFQGDVRDAIILTLGQPGPAPTRPSHRFGVLSAEGGDRRVAVALTRAREMLTVVAPAPAVAFPPGHAIGLGDRLIADFLRSVDAAPDAARDKPDTMADRDVDPLLAELAARLRQEGLTVHQGYGRAAHPIDLAVEDPYAPGRVVVAVEGDGAQYARIRTARDREYTRPGQLRRLGWEYVRVWGTDVFRDPARDVARVVDAVRSVDVRSSWSRPTRRRD